MYAKHEVSAVYAGASCAGEIAIELGWLEKQAAGCCMAGRPAPGLSQIATAARA